MCGINGIIKYNNSINLLQELTRMNASLNHRGPDFQGIWCNKTNQIALGHTRLSIIDLTETGNQPMHSKSGKFTIVFNGEIYNYLEIKKEIRKISNIKWIGSSDTEVIIEAFELFGVEKTLNLMQGMFAFGLFNNHEHKLILGRDRMGEKPLYYGYVNAHFVFTSELSAIKNISFFNNAISNDALSLYMKYSSVPEPYSIYTNIYKLEASNYLEFDLKNNQYKIVKYWDIDDIANSAKNYFNNDKEAIDTLNDLLIETIHQQMIADVPIGAFLSGGIDSSLVAAIMQSLSSNKINTFSIGFENPAYDESKYAQTVSKHIGSNHYDLIVSDKDLLDVVPLISSIYAEPFSESSQIPTYLVSKIAKQKVTVALTGDAGDELFCGYSRYHLANSINNKLSLLPLNLRNTISRGFKKMPFSLLKAAFLPFGLIKGNYGRNLNHVDRFLKFLEIFNLEKGNDFYSNGFLSLPQGTDKLLRNYQNPKTKYSFFSNNNANFYEQMMLLDLKTYLPNNNLTKVDRAAMNVSLETRVPLLNHKIVEFALQLPLSYKYREGKDKWILKQVLYQYVPEAIFNRPKKGFSVPLESWLKGPLKEWSESKISKTEIDKYAFFNFNEVNKKWQEHQSGKRNWSDILWKVILFQDWISKK